MKALLSIALLFICITSYAQDENVEKYFDDGGLGNLQNAFKIDILPSAGGDVTFIYERFLSDFWSVEAGGGFLLGYGVNPFIPALASEEPLYNRSGGYKVVFSGLYHPNKDRLDGYVYGITGYYRSMNNVEMNNRVISNRADTYIGYYCGRRYDLGVTTSLEIGLSIGPLFYSDDSIEIHNSLFDNTEVNFTLSLKLALHK